MVATKFDQRLSGICTQPYQNTGPRSEHKQTQTAKTITKKVFALKCKF